MGTATRPATPDAIQRFEVFGTVLHDNADTVTLLQAVLTAQTPADARRAFSKLSVGSVNILARANGAVVGPDTARAS